MVPFEKRGRRIGSYRILNTNMVAWLTSAREELLKLQDKTRQENIFVCLVGLAVLPLIIHVCPGEAWVWVGSTVYLRDNSGRQVPPFVILLTFPSPSCYPPTLGRFVHVDLGVIRGTNNFGEGNEVSRIIFPQQGSRWLSLLS